MKLPTPNELAAVAAALTRNGSRKPENAATEALSLWRACCAEIDAAQNEAEERARQEREAARHPDQAIIYMQKPDGTYPAMEWVNQNADHDRDRFKTFRGFKAAWLQFYPKEEDFYFSHQIGDLRKFLAWKREKRIAAETGAKRIKRQSHKASGDNGHKLTAKKHKRL